MAYPASCNLICSLAMKSDSSTKPQSWMPAIWGAVAIATGLIAFWLVGMSPADPPPETEPSPEAASPERAAVTSQGTDAPQKPAAASPASAEQIAPGVSERLFSKYGFKVELDSAWTVETGTAGLRVLLNSERFFVLRTPSPTARGAMAEPPGNQEVVVARRVAGTDVLCTVDPGTSDEVRAIAKKACESVKDLGGLGTLTGFKCEADSDIDLDVTTLAVESVREPIIGCFTAAHRGETQMSVGQASVAIEPSPEGVPMTILVGGDVPTELAFHWLKGCLTQLFREVKVTKQGEGDGMLRCEFNWSLE